MTMRVTELLLWNRRQADRQLLGAPTNSQPRTTSGINQTKTQSCIRIQGCYLVQHKSTSKLTLLRVPAASASSFFFIAFSLALSSRAFHFAASVSAAVNKAQPTQHNTTQPVTDSLAAPHSLLSLSLLALCHSIVYLRAFGPQLTDLTD